MSGEEQERRPRGSEDAARYRPVPRISSDGRHLDAGDAEQAPPPAPTRFAPRMARGSTVGTTLTLAPSDENTDPLSWTAVNADEFVGNLTTLSEGAVQPDAMGYESPESGDINDARVCLLYTSPSPRD